MKPPFDIPVPSPPARRARRASPDNTAAEQTDHPNPLRQSLDAIVTIRAILESLPDRERQRVVKAIALLFRGSMSGC